MRGRFISCLGLFVLITCVGRALAADPDWFNPTTMRGFRPNIPDFYQHQYWCDDMDWEKEGGWCRETAWANCLYSWQVQGYGGLLPADIDKQDKWQKAACDGIKDLEMRPDGMKGYLQDHGHGEKAGVLPGQGLVFQQYCVDDMGKITYQSSDGRMLKRAGTAFDVYKQELKAGQDVLVKIAAPPKADGSEYDPSLWWTAQCTAQDPITMQCVQTKNLGGDPNMGVFHYVTGVGVDCKTMEMFFADPDSNKGSKRADAGNSWDCPDAAVNGRKYTPADRDPPVAPRGANPSDDPMNFDKYYGTWKIGADGFTITGGVENPDRYKDTKINKIETICPTSGILFDGINPSNGKNEATVTVRADPSTTIDELLLYPTIPVDMTVAAMITAAIGTSDSWKVSYISPSGSYMDPDGNLRTLGALDFTLASGGGLDGTEMLQAKFGLLGLSMGNFDLMSHVLGTSDWLTQAVGASEMAYPDQGHVTAPEPGSLAAMGLVLVIGVYRRRR